MDELAELFDYMAGWNADHMHGVTDHEIQMMRLAAAEGRRILDRTHRSEHGTGWLHGTGTEG